MCFPSIQSGTALCVDRGFIIIIVSFSECELGKTLRNKIFNISTILSRRCEPSLVKKQGSRISPHDHWTKSFSFSLFFLFSLFFFSSSFLFVLYLLLINTRLFFLNLSFASFYFYSS